MFSWNFVKFLRTPFSRTPPVTASVLIELRKTFDTIYYDIFFEVTPLFFKQIN